LLRCVAVEMQCALGAIEILVRDPANQGLNTRGNRRPTGPGLQAPEQVPSGAMPTDPGFRTHYHQSVLPAEEP